MENVKLKQKKTETLENGSVVKQGLKLVKTDEKLQSLPKGGLKHLGKQVMLLLR